VCCVLIVVRWAYLKNVNYSSHRCGDDTGVEADASGAGDGATAAAAVDEASIHVADELSHLQPGTVIRAGND